MITHYPAGFEPPRAVSAVDWVVLVRGLVGGMSGGSQHPMRTPVIGYLRSDRPDRAALDEAGERLTAHAAGHGLELIAVYRDDGVPDTASTRPAFAAMVTALTEGKAAGVLVPVEHLSPDPDVRALLVARVQATGAALYLVET